MTATSSRRLTPLLLLLWGTVFVSPGICYSLQFYELLESLDLAYKRPAYSGPRHSGSSVASKGNDRNTYTHSYTDSESHEHAWWMVDLQESAFAIIAHIYFLGGSDIVVDVFTEDPRSLWGFPENISGVVCPHEKYWGFNYYVVAAICDWPVEARFVRIMRPPEDEGQDFFLYSCAVYPRPATLQTFEGSSSNGLDFVEEERGVASSKLSCARQFMRRGGMDGFQWDSITKDCILYGHLNTSTTPSSNNDVIYKPQH